MAAKSPEAGKTADAGKDKAQSEGKLKLSKQTLTDLEAIVKEARGVRQSRKVCVAAS